MGIYTDDENLVIIIAKTVHVDLPIKINKSQNCNIKFIISHNESLVEYAIKYDISQILVKYGHEHEHEK